MAPKTLRPVSEIEKESNQQCLEKTYASVIEEIEDKVILGEIFVTFHPKKLNTHSIVQMDMWLEIEKKINAIDGYHAKIYPETHFTQFALCVAIQRPKSVMDRISFWDNPSVNPLIFATLLIVIFGFLFVFCSVGLFLITESPYTRNDRWFNIFGSGFINIVLYVFVYKHAMWYRDWNKLMFGKK